MHWAESAQEEQIKRVWSWNNCPWQCPAALTFLGQVRIIWSIHHFIQFRHWGRGCFTGKAGQVFQLHTAVTEVQLYLPTPVKWFLWFPLLHISGPLKPSSSWMRGPMAVRWPTELLLKFHSLIWVFHADKMHLTLPEQSSPTFLVYTGKNRTLKALSSQYILFSTECSCVCSRAQKLFKTGQKKNKHTDLKSSLLRGVQFGNCH